MVSSWWRFLLIHVKGLRGVGRVPRIGGVSSGDVGTLYYKVLY